MTYFLQGVWAPNGVYFFTLHPNPLTTPQGANEKLLGGILRDPELRSKVFICTKFGVSSRDGNAVICGRPEYVRERCEESLKNLEVEYIDLYYQHRVCRSTYRSLLMHCHTDLVPKVDRSIPIEETWKEMSALQAEGKVKYLGISEATAEEIRRANSVAKVSALQIEVL
jgi:aryl-alcohol dehydrogenase-like predicted oxidoreductase